LKYFYRRHAHVDGGFYTIVVAAEKIPPSMVSAMLKGSWLAFEDSKKHPHHPVPVHVTEIRTLQGVAPGVIIQGHEAALHKGAQGLAGGGVVDE